MSLYNMIHGHNPAVKLVLPLLKKNPGDYPRFRDCFLEDEEHPSTRGKIHIYTRVGGGNREEYEEDIERLRNMPGFVEDYDEEFDNTYATFVYEAPDPWKDDVLRLLDGKLAELSTEYKQLMYDTYPDVKDNLRKLFGDFHES